MQLLISIGLCSLAVFRLSNMVANEDGPFDIFSWWREKLGQANWIGRGFNCVLCVSFWLSAITSLYLSKTAVECFLYWFAIAGAVMCMHKYFNRLR